MAWVSQRLCPVSGCHGWREEKRGEREGGEKKRKKEGKKRPRKRNN
jgi:hypothetical protein